MNMNLHELITTPKKLADRTILQELKEILVVYPYFHVARLLYLKGLYLLHDEHFGEELRRAVFYISDRRVLFCLIEGEKYVLKPTVRRKSKDELASADRTLTLIDAFLKGTALYETEEHSDDGGLSGDYVAYVLREEDYPDLPQTGISTSSLGEMKGQDLIDEFIRSSEKKVTLSENVSADTPIFEPDDGEDDSYFTETLAKIYIKQQRYAKALEIIKRLSLKYPKKSIYFADQIQALEKLVINSNENH